MNISPTYKQLIWCNQQGGRGITDIVVEGKQMGIYMLNDRAMERFYKLPSDKNLILKERNEGTKELKRISYYVREK
jgi:hypothetical protein